MDRAGHIEGLRLDGMMPGDIESFFKTLAPRIPKRAHPDRQATLDALRSRLKALAVDIGALGGVAVDADDPDALVGVIVDHLGQLKRRQWKRDDGAGEKLIDRVRAAVGEISADLAELTTH